jgi:metal-responsive CopG/Arc/MetJ family transcriptional regulator
MPRAISGNAKEVITIRIERELLTWLDSQSNDRSSVIRSAIASYQEKKSQTSYARFLRDSKHSTERQWHI